MVQNPHEIVASLHPRDGILYTDRYMYGGPDDLSHLKVLAVLVDKIHSPLGLPLEADERANFNALPNWRPYMDELFWLLDHGILLDRPLERREQFEGEFAKRLATREAALLESFGLPESIKTAMLFYVPQDLSQGVGGDEARVALAVKELMKLEFARTAATLLADRGYQAFGMHPLSALSLAFSELQEVMPSSVPIASEPLEVATLVLDKLEIPDAEQTPWEAVIDLRADAELTGALRGLRSWMVESTASLEQGTQSMEQIQEDLNDRLSAYSRQIRKHKLTLTTGALQTVVPSGIATLASGAGTTGLISWAAAISVTACIQGYHSRSMSKIDLPPDGVATGVTWINDRL